MINQSLVFSKLRSIYGDKNVEMRVENNETIFIITEVFQRAFYYKFRYNTIVQSCNTIEDFLSNYQSLKENL